jgi:hypothetical protein
MPTAENSFRLSAIGSGKFLPLPRQPSEYSFQRLSQAFEFALFSAAQAVFIDGTSLAGIEVDG